METLRIRTLECQLVLISPDLSAPAGSLPGAPKPDGVASSLLTPMDPENYSHTHIAKCVIVCVCVIEQDRYNWFLQILY